MSRSFSQSTTSAPGPAGSAAPAERSTEFRSVTGGGEIASGEVLLVEAYAAFWLVAFVMIVRSMLRQRRLDQRIERLEQDLARVRGSMKGDAED